MLQTSLKEWVVNHCGV